jgi:putative membrane protein
MMMCGWWNGAWWDGSTLPWYGMIFGPIMMIVFVVLTVLIIAWVLRALGLGWQPSAQGHSALDTLKERFACGEIDQAEFEKRKQLLSGA